jgi:hypothetical protein
MPAAYPAESTHSFAVRDHRVVIRSRRRSRPLVSLAPRAFSSGAGLASPVYQVHQSDRIVCRLEMSWNCGLNPRTLAGRFPLPPRTEHRPRLPCKPICTPCTMHWLSCKSASKPSKLGSRRIPRPPPGPRRRTPPIRSRAIGSTPPPRAKPVGNRAIQAIARSSCHPRPCTRCAPSSVRVGTRR